MFGLSLEHLPIYPFLAVTAASYLLIVRHNRFQRVRKYERKLGFEGLSQAEIYEKITTQDAETIIAYMSQLEFPKIFTVSLQFALFRVCAYPPPTGSAIIITPPPR